MAALQTDRSLRDLGAPDRVCRFDELAQRTVRQNIEQICCELGITSRSLRYDFQHYFGTSPRRYLKLRRLYLVRAALLHADPETASVTRIAAHYGISEFGRFAGEYRLLFGELPSQTLKRRV